MPAAVLQAFLGLHLSSDEQMLQKARQESSLAFGNMLPNWDSSLSCLRVNEKP